MTMMGPAPPWGDPLVGWRGRGDCSREWGRCCGDGGGVGLGGNGVLCFSLGSRVRGNDVRLAGMTEGLRE